MSVRAYTDDQKAAISVDLRHLDACVVAGPGSGKTTVLVEHFKGLVHAGVDPLRILAITFTEKAAGNLRDKVADAFAGDLSMRGRLERAWISTVHGFCARLLRENAVYAGVDPEFAMSDERESLRLQTECVGAAMEEAFKADRAEVRRFIRALAPAEFEDAVVKAYDAMRGAGMTLDQTAALLPPPGRTPEDIRALISRLRRDPLRGWQAKHKIHLEDAIAAAQAVVDAPNPREALTALAGFNLNLNKIKKNTEATEVARELKDAVPLYEYSLITQLYAPERQFLIGILRAFDRLYRERKRALGLLDFSDLEEFTVRLLEHSPEVRTRLQGQFEHILMDEFQDTNGQQARLLSLIRAPGRFYAVGDINQSIFGFRHAEPRGFAEYRDQVARDGRRLINLTGNFRSRAPILRAVESICNPRPGVEDRKLVPGKQFDRDRPTCVEVIGAIGLADDAVAIEARWVARRILELKRDEPFRFRDFAVLLRNTEVIPAFLAAFEEAGIPYLVSRARGFFDNREVADLVHLLRVISNPRDEISLAAVLRSPLVNAGDEALLTLRMVANGNLADGLQRVGADTQAEFTPDDYARLTRFRARLRGWRARRDSVSFDRLLLAAIDDCAYRAESGPRGEANVEKFLAQARAASTKMTLDEYVDDLAVAREKDPRERDAPLDDSIEAVKLMTVHSAKGLEFPVVFVSAIHKGVKTDLEAIEFSPRFGIGARWRNPASGQPKDDLYLHAIRKERDERESHEADRLLYVAMTRAEEHLALTFSGKRHKEWDAAVIAATQFDSETLADEIVEMHSPDGEPWNLRKLVVDSPPELLRHEGDATSAASIEWLALPDPGGQRDSNATVTALTAFSRCPRLYYLGHYLNLDATRGRPRDPEADDPPDDLPADEIGRQTHALLAGLPVEEPNPEAARLADVFRKSALGKRLAHATRIEREFDFLMNVEDLVIRGQVDLWFEEGGELVIVDYKTDSVSGLEAHEKARGYELQLRLYAMAVERVAGRPVDRAWLHFLRPDKAIEVDIAPSLLESPESIVREFLEAQDSLQFPVHEAPHCRGCEFFKGLCDSKYGA